MFEPEIHWHYYGKLQTQLEDAACEHVTRRLEAALRSEEQGNSCLLIPTTDADALGGAIGRLFKAASMKVYTSAFGGREPRGLSTVHSPGDADFVLSCFSGPPDDLAQHLQPNTLIRRIFIDTQKARASRVFLVISSLNERRNAVDISADIQACRSMAHTAERRGYRTEILPEPGLRREALLDMVRTAPSRILDGSHSSERELERQVSDAANSPPIGPMLAEAWRHLKSGTDPGLLFRAEFDARVKRLGDAAQAYPWEAIVSFWQDVLYGLDSDEEYAGRWYAKINARADGWVPLNAIDDISLHEAAIYCLHARVDSACVSYPVVYHGSRWLQRRMALASLFEGIPLGPGRAWE